MTLAKLPHPCSRPSPASMQAKAQSFRVLLTPLTYIHVGQERKEFFLWFFFACFAAWRELKNILSPYQSTA